MPWCGSKYSQGTKDSNRDQTIDDQMLRVPYSGMIISFDVGLMLSSNMKAI